MFMITLESNKLVWAGFDFRRSGLLTAFRTPAWPRFSFPALHDHLYARGITLYPGKLPGADTFRVANMGALVPADLAAFVAEVGRFLDAR